MCDLALSPAIRFSPAVTGSRMKLMRDVHMWQRDTGPPLFRIGLGCQFELEPNNASDFSLQVGCTLACC